MNDLIATLLWPTVTLVAGAVLLAPLGVEVLRRGIVFVDLAIAQAAALAALLVQMRWHDAGSPLAVAAAGILGATVAAMLVRLLASRLARGREAAIGLLYVAGASGGLIASAYDAHGAAHFTHLLAADVLWADRAQALTLGVLAFMVLVLARRRGLLERDGVFYAALGIAVAPALMALGLYAVFALLIAPALWSALRVRSTAGRPSAVKFAVTSALAALALSVALDLPSGATVACVVSLAGLLPTIRRHGTHGETVDPTAGSS